MEARVTDTKQKVASLYPVVDTVEMTRFSKATGAPETTVRPMPYLALREIGIFATVVGSCGDVGLPRTASCWKEGEECRVLVPEFSIQSIHWHMMMSVAGVFKLFASMQYLTPMVWRSTKRLEPLVTHDGTASREVTDAGIS